MRQTFWIVILGLAFCLFYSCSKTPQQELVIEPLAEKRILKLPEGELFWRIETANSLQEAQAAETPWSLVVESNGRIWLFTLSTSVSTSLTQNLTKVAEVGPISRINAAEYLLRINEASGPQGSITPIHSHPGSEAYFVLTGQQSIRGNHGTIQVNAGQAEAGHGADQAMQVSSSGTDELHSLVMFVVDANRPFSSPATFP